MSERSFIAGSGTYLPGEPVPFDSIESVLGELTEAPERIRRWMRKTKPLMAELLDVKFFHYAIDPATGEFTDDNVTMAVKASRLAMEAAGMGPGDIDLICYGSPHQDQMPTASVRIQEQLGIEACEEISIHANCTSAYKALHLANELIRSGRNQNALVVSSNIASSELRAGYYNQALVDRESLFLRWFLCDGAGAIILTADPSRSRGFEVEHTYIESIGGRRPSLMYNLRPAYWMNPKEEYEKGFHHLRQQFRNALSTPIFQEEEGSVFLGGLRRMLSRGAIPIDRIKLLQVNLPARHIAESVMDECEKLGIRRSCFYTKLDELGYCGPPMALICLDRIVREEPFEKGDLVVSFVTEVSKFMQAGYSVSHVGSP
jgi:3-oxoacyl-[acyl-carrier-protein] synthase-3